MTRGLKTRNGGRWTEAQFMSQFRNALRKLSMYWQTGKDYIKTIRYKSRFYHIKLYDEWVDNMLLEENYPVVYVVDCEICEDTYRQTEIELDHKVPCGSLKKLEDLQGFVERMFIEQDGWQVLCHSCHLKKTKEERK